MTKMAIGALAGLLVLSACSTKSETANGADTATIPGMDTTQTVLAIPISEAVPRSQLAAADSARIRDSLRAKEERDAQRAKEARDSANRVAERAKANRRRY